MDLVSDSTDTAIAGAMAHIEEAGVHSGDSFAVFPPLGIDERLPARVKDQSRLSSSWISPTEMSTGEASLTRTSLSRMQ